MIELKWNSSHRIVRIPALFHASLIVSEDKTIALPSLWLGNLELQQDTVVISEVKDVVYLKHIIYSDNLFNSKKSTRIIWLNMLIRHHHQRINVRYVFNENIEKFKEINANVCVTATAYVYTTRFDNLWKQ